MVATRDLGAVAAQVLLTPASTSETADVIGPAYSEREVATALGRALGRELQIATMSEDAWLGALTEAGFRLQVAEQLAELYRADEAGLLAPRGDRRIHVATPIETTIARILAPAESGSVR